MVVAVAFEPSLVPSVPPLSSWEGSKYGVEKDTFTDADADDLSVHERSDDYEEEEIDYAPTSNFSVWYRKSLTVGVKKKKTIPLLWCVTWDDKQDIWWEEVVGGDCEGSVGIQ